MKICVIGFSGSGKSSFATKLGLHYEIEPTYIDKFQFEPGWVVRDPLIRNQMLQEVVDKDEWVIDGNYAKAVPERFKTADQIFIFNFNRFKCLYGALLRRIKYHKKSRRSITEGNEEKFDFEFFMWIMFQSRTKERRMFYKKLLKEYKDKTIVFTKRKQVNKYLTSIGIFDFKEKS